MSRVTSGRSGRYERRERERGGGYVNLPLPRGDWGNTGDGDERNAASGEIFPNMVPARWWTCAWRREIVVLEHSTAATK